MPDDDHPNAAQLESKRVLMKLILHYMISYRFNAFRVCERERVTIQCTSDCDVKETNFNNGQMGSNPFEICHQNVQPLCMHLCTRSMHCTRKGTHITLNPVLLHDECILLDVTSLFRLMMVRCSVIWFKSSFQSQY